MTFICVISLMLLLNCKKSAQESNPVSAIKDSITASQDWEFELGEYTVVANHAQIPTYPWHPDGHISVLKNQEEYIMFWANFENYRTIGATPFPEDHLSLSPRDAVFGGRFDRDAFNNGGSWLMSVHRIEGDNLIGFYHAEDHWYPRQWDYAWKSIGVARSFDKGKIWMDEGQIIRSSTPKPAFPAHGGNGDHCVIWNEDQKRWICYYQEHFLQMAISEDPFGQPGSWYKYYNGGFTEPGLGGKSTPIPILKNIAGANPSVHYNAYLKLWIMVWHRWDPPEIYIASSTDGSEWVRPHKLVSGSQGGKAWYPTIIGETDTKAGEQTILYYADFSADGNTRKFVSRSLTFIRHD
jgi:hypothetical protein